LQFHTDAYDMCTNLGKEILPILLSSMVEAENFSDHPRNYVIKLFKTKRKLPYLKTQCVPRSKHASSRLQKPSSLCRVGHKSLFVLR